MKQVLRRIAIHGAFTAILLGVIGFMLAELASIWLAAPPDPRSVPGATVEATDTFNPNGKLASDLRKRVPLMMAIWGFAFVAIAELVLHAWRSRKPVTQPAVTAPQPDPAEKLLEEILAKVEAERKAQEPVDRGQETEVRDQRSEVRDQRTENREQRTEDKKQEPQQQPQPPTDAQPTKAS
jgi:hypothetical protein